MTFADEFPDFPAADFPAAIPDGFVDSSWHNDACPSLASDELNLQIFIDYTDLQKREFPDSGERFTVSTLDADGAPLRSVHADDWDEVLTIVRRISTGGVL